jgi:hypothetical protein
MRGRGLTVHVLEELFADEAGAGDDDALDDLKIDVSQDTLHHVLVELVQRLT